MTSSKKTASGSLSPARPHRLTLATVLRPLRKGWAWLTSMRTALMLLFLLAIAAIPGAILPQRSLNESKVTTYIAENGNLGKIYDKLQLFDVFSSTWFTAIYLLLFISLIGCILPRSWEHYRAMRSRPVRAPRNLNRLPMYRAAIVSDDLSRNFSSYTSSIFKGWHTSTFQPEEDRRGQWSLSAEKGFLREFCNLVFHLGLVLVLVMVAGGKMVYYEGQVIVIAGNENSQFCNSAVANFDSFRHGALVDGTGLTPYCVQVEDFSADYLANGQAKMFTSNIKYATKDDVNKPVSEWTDYQLRVNHPLRISGDRVYLQGHGFAPSFTFTWPNGESRTVEMQWQPTDMTTFLSAGVIRVDPPAGMYPDLLDRRSNQIAIQGIFAPTASFSGDNNALLTSSFPSMTDPAVAVDIYIGDAGLDTGVGQSIFALDSSLIADGLLNKDARVNLRAGEKATLSNGVTVQFDGAKQFVNLQISHDPTQGWLLAVAIVMLAGLIGSVSIKRRRMWIRVTPLAGGVAAGPGADGSSTGEYLVEIAGLARTDRAGWGKEFARKARTILNEPEPEYDDDEDED